MPCPPLIRAFLVSMLALFCGGCVGLIPLYHSATSIEGWAIDSDTHKPVEGAILTANWKLEGGTNDDQMMVYETTTDPSGYFRFPAWGPIARPLDRRLSITRSPQIIVFKTGYLPIIHIEHPLTTDIYLETERHSEWNKQTIFLIPTTSENGKTYKKLLEDAATALYHLDNKNCDFRRTPRLVDAMKAAHAIPQEGLTKSCDKPGRKE